VAQVAAVAAVGVVALAGCRPAPPTSGTGRYRSQVFNSVEKVANITYATAPGKGGAAQTLLLDLYKPAGDTVTKRPLFISAYGGAFIFGSKDGTYDPAYQMAQYYAKRGYVTAMINYRLLASGTCTGNNPTESCRAAATAGVEDGVAAVRFLRANAGKYGIDPDRIAFGGDSAGGVIAAGVGVMSEVAPTTNTSTPGVSGRIQAFMAISGGLPDTTGVDANDSPGILFTGTADTIVPSSYSTTLAAGLNAVGVEAKVVTFPNAGHVPWGQKDTILGNTTDFFYQHLDLANAAR
jgi:para-nitrobenzyl esterase